MLGREKEEQLLWREKLLGAGDDEHVCEERRCTGGERLMVVASLTVTSELQWRT